MKNIESEDEFMKLKRQRHSKTHKSQSRFDLPKSLRDYEELRKFGYRDETYETLRSDYKHNA